MSEEISVSDEKKTVDLQLQFVEWLKLNKMYNINLSATTMQSMYDVWVKTREELSIFDQDLEMPPHRLCHWLLPTVNPKTGEVENIHEIYKPFDFYAFDDVSVTVDGHRMFPSEVVKDLNDYRRGYLKLKAEIDKYKSSFEGIDDVPYAMENIKKELKTINRDLSLLLGKWGVPKHKLDTTTENTLKQDLRRIRFMLKLFEGKKS